MELTGEASRRDEVEIKWPRWRTEFGELFFQGNEMKAKPQF